MEDSIKAYAPASSKNRKPGRFQMHMDGANVMAAFEWAKKSESHELRLRKVHFPQDFVQIPAPV